MLRTPCLLIVACLSLPSFAGDVPDPPANITSVNTDDPGRWNCQTGVLDSLNPNASTTSFAGTVVVSDDSPLRYWIIKFDLPTPPGRPAVLNNAWVSVKSRGSKNSLVYRCLKPWSSANKSWNYVLGSNGLTLGVDVASERTADFLGKNADEPHLFFVTNDVIDMYTNGGNNGWLVTPWLQPGTSEIYAADVITDHRKPQMGIVWVYEQADPNFDGTPGYQITDMNAIIDHVADQSYAADADLDYDGEIDLADRDLMFGVLDSELGDVNGDGDFDSSDLVAMFQAGKYETQQPAMYTQGDLNGDGYFDSGDMVAAFQAGTYENGAAALAADWDEIIE